MAKLTCTIIEDDPMSLAIVEKLAIKSGLIEVIEKFQSADAALPWLLENTVQLLFLDVEMPGISGLDMMKSLPYKPDVIVISGKSEYAVAAFDLSVTDYLVKPVTDYSRFITAVNKVVVKQKLSFNSPKSDDSLFV
jgi:two-component SAPR family response regulator